MSRALFWSAVACHRFVTVDHRGLFNKAVVGHRTPKLSNPIDIEIHFELYEGSYKLSILHGRQKGTLARRFNSLLIETKT